MMSWSHLRAAGIVLVALLAFPGSSHAGIFDFIWELSGPRLVTWLTFDCEFNLINPGAECRIYDIKVAGDAPPRAGRRLWLALDNGFYTSIDKGEYRRFENHMFAIEPMLRWQSQHSRHGVGVTYNLLYGANFKTFDALGLKIVPFTIPARRVVIIPTIRFYTDSFIAPQFGVGKATSEDVTRKGELVIGASVEFR
jgi:hypothetical protein